jgi:hypothetical protein
MKIRTGHQYGYITLDVRVLETGPAADLAAWEAVEQDAKVVHSPVVHPGECRLSIT